MVVIFHGLHICGAARHCVELLAVMRRAGVFTTVVATQGGGHWADLFLENCNEMVLTTWPSLNAHEISSVEWRAARRIVSAHYDPAISWACRADGEAELYAHFHTEPEYGLFTLQTLRIAGERARRLFFPSAATLKSYARLVHYAAPWWGLKAHVLPNAIPRSAQLGEPAVPTADDSGSDGLRLAIVCRLDPDKLDVSLMLGTLARLQASLPRLQVKVAGSGLLVDDVRTALRREGLDTTVELLGWVADVGPLYAWADVTFVPSYREAMPYAALESVGTRTPVVVPTHGHFAHHEDLNPLVFTFDPGEPDSAATQIQKASAAEPASEPIEAFDPERWDRQVVHAYDLC